MAPAAGAGAQPTDSVIAKWRSYDRAIASASPTQRPAAVGKQDLRSPDARDAATTHKRSHGSRPTMFNASSTDLRSPDARDAADGRGTFTAPDVTVVSVPRTAPTSSGIDWADVGIGAGGVLGVALLALGGAVAVAVHRGRGARKPARIA
ncbi:MAG TPA: hypothetical protein VFG79_24300 [Solirubrobacter sp.]|nr:hypothetical protein [Solirubrobacter sp.]